MRERAMNLDEIKELTAYALSDRDLADCGSPDTLESAGAVFLRSVRDDFVRAVEDGTYDEDDTPHAIANEAPSVYTHEKWQEFVDLAAYHEDVSELTDGSDMDKAGSVALYIIAERLVRALYDALSEDEETDEDEDA